MHNFHFLAHNPEGTNIGIYIGMVALEGKNKNEIKMS